jgi:hypothetical protein
MDGRVWIPTLGWQKIARPLYRRLERFFSVPMIAVALLILPVLAIEHYWNHLLAQPRYRWLLALLDISTSIIWLAFATEFVIMVSVAKSKWKYCISHWVDLAIILLPLISFLRCLRALRVARLMRLQRVAKLTQALSNMGRLYRLRGLAFRAYRALLILELLERIWPMPPERRLERLREQLNLKEEELRELRRTIQALEQQVQAECRGGVEADTPPDSTDHNAQRVSSSMDGAVSKNRQQMADR